MKTINVKNFGPIADSGRIDVMPVTVLCGAQGSGKSTLAKLISVCTWIEKSIMRHQLKTTDVTRYSHFAKRYCAYHNMLSYFKEDTFIEYNGDGISLTYEHGKTMINKTPAGSYVMPQICYIPAERNLLLAIERAEKIRKLPPALEDLLADYLKALQSSSLPKSLPVEGSLSVSYDKLNRVSWLHGAGFRVRANEAASGFQSLIPLLFVTRYHAMRIREEVASPMSVEERERLHREILKILNNTKLAEEMRVQLIAELNAGLLNECFINIVEEPEQNLFPLTQEKVVFELLAEYGRSRFNNLLLTTHSPYILNALSLAVKAGELFSLTEDRPSLKTRLEEIVPEVSAVLSSEVAIYELKADGTVERLPMPNGLPSDDNFLNNSIERSNRMFDLMLQIEDDAQA